MRISPAADADKADWLALRCALWPHQPEQSLQGDLDRLLDDAGRHAVFIARDDGGVMVGFAEASLRHDYVNGCETSPVAFLEGIYVALSHRRRGFARALVDAVACWARERHCSEFASDALLDNVDSHRMHRALGFEETERVVYFRKTL